MDWIAREEQLRNLALDILGVERKQSPGGSFSWPSQEAIRYGYHCRMLKHHPDRNPDDPRAQDIAALINEAFGLLSGKSVTPTLLLDETLVQLVLKNPVGPLDDVPTYREWLLQQFCNVEDKSIWTY